MLAAWGWTARDVGRPCVWIHAPSVGEGLQARAVLEALRARRADLQAVYTHFSPSAESLARAMPADVASYLPWDVPGTVRGVLDAVRPSLIVFTKTEAWPTLVEEAVRRAIPSALVGGSMPQGSGRLSWPARPLLRSTWARMRLVATISETDAKGFGRVGVPPHALHVTGDPGIDSAAERARGADPGATHIRPFHEDPRPTVVAGSTWPADEAVLLPAFRALRRSVPSLRVILAPHEPTPARVAELRGRFQSDAWATATLSDIEKAASARGLDAVVVDRVGVLAHLYTVGSVAYVGGGFHRAGLHSVLEPAAARIPVVFGPHHENAPAAGELLACGGGRRVGNAHELEEVLAGWLASGVALADTAREAFGYIQRHLGAADRTAALLDRLLPPSS
jgi:3-deoxy-D-manno-octulosonic-acid transferase